jgi:signal transduction histidine kinase
MSALGGMQHADAPGHRLAALLRERREELIQKWTERVLHDPRLPSANRLSRPELHDHVPEMLDDFVRLLEASEASEASGRCLGASDAAREHARQRLAKRFPLDETLREFSHFRAALIDLCTEAGIALEGDVAELVHATVDENMITGASEMEQAKLAELTQRAAFRERFVGIVGHDLRNPLQAIRFALDVLLKRKDTTGEQGKILGRAVASADRMTRMIHDLLDLTRARLGDGIPIERKPTELDVVCQQVIDELSIAHPARAVELDRGPSVCCDCDPDRIAQVVSNLIGNALKYSPPDTPVRITLREEGGAALLSVHNRGTPISAEELGHLFDPFWRGPREKGNKSGEDSLGLGLFIVKQIVCAHGGSIDVTSTPGEGTTFTARLPRADQGSRAPSRS